MFSLTADPALDALTGYTATVATYGAALVGVVVAAIGVTYGIGWLRKVRSAK
jgi:hypothetical protein